MIMIGLFWLVVVLFVLRWIYPGSGDRALPDATRHLEAEVARLRDEVDRLSGRMERLQDEQSFLLRLLDRADRPAALPGDRTERSGTGSPAPPPAGPADQTPTH